MGGSKAEIGWTMSFDRACKIFGSKFMGCYGGIIFNESCGTKMINPAVRLFVPSDIDGYEDVLLHLYCPTRTELPTPKAIRDARISLVVEHGFDPGKPTIVNFTWGGEEYM